MWGVGCGGYRLHALQDDQLFGLPGLLYIRGLSLLTAHMPQLNRFSRENPSVPVFAGQEQILEVGFAVWNSGFQVPGLEFRV